VRRIVIALLVVACSSDDTLPAHRVPSCPARLATFVGEATHYDADGRGNCSFEASDGMVAAVNGGDYDRAAWCGACLEVTGPSGAVVVRVVDKCPGCKPGDLDLGQAAFAALAPLAEGRIPIRWRPVACDVTGPIAYRFKDGSNAFWTAIQIRNHRHPIKKLEWRDATGAWSAIDRAEYNYFVTTRALGKGPYVLRVTDAYGHEVVDEGIALGDAVTRAGAAQLPACLEPWL
jgi:expansin (peptidoglycan-binding protein)